MDEMTEASERIYNEVGENAEIIWGAVIDDNVGDEMRVTVIATGIGMDKALEREAPRTAAKAKDPTYGGKLRDLTPADLNSGSLDLDEPTYIRRRRVANDPMNDFRDLAVDTDDLEVPTFLRRKAD
jgi:cell division protein FtsZ